jgi:AcrR family transcriptional regulator
MLGPTKRELQREENIKDIKATARRHMAEQGTAAISLRAVARDMDMTAPAIYRYFPSLDDLITALIVDAFNASADVLEAAAAEQPHNDYYGRLKAIFMAYRQWALDHQPEFELIYGNAIPGYHAPEDITVPAARRSFIPVGNVIHEAIQAGQLKLISKYTHMRPTVRRHIAGLIEHEHYPITPEEICLLAHLWSVAHGMIMLEIHGHFSPIVGDSPGYYEDVIGELLQEIGLKPKN